MILTQLQRRVLLGDVLVLAVTTVAGFASHGVTGAWARMALTFVLALGGWLWFAPWFGLLDESVCRRPGRVWWRIIWAWTATGPFVTVVRTLLLGTTLNPVFTLVFTSTNILAFLVWRVLYALRSSKGYTNP